MNQEIKNKWIAALKSGEYKQGKGRLRNLDNTFCCLGVLCDLHSKETGNQFTESEGESYFHYMYHSSFLPEPVVKWANLITSDPHVKGTSIAELNDYNKSFNELADLIYTHL